MDAQQAFDSAMAILSDLPPNDRVRLGEGDLRVVVRSYAVRCLARLGRPEQALRTGIEAERIGRSLADDRFSLAWAIFVRSTGYYHMGDHRATFADAEEIIAICEEHAFSARLGNGLMRRGFARARLGDMPMGIQEFRRGRALWRDLRVVHHSAEHATELCDLLVETAELSEAEALLNDIDELVGGTDETACLAECQRIRGMIAARKGDALSAIPWFESAIATARGQSALLFELRAATYLAELMADRGRGVEGAHRLSDVYARFTEGHRAPDLVAAKTLLQRLAP
jgi:tetratricopeptide (TPR) repeat protein